MQKTVPHFLKYLQHILEFILQNCN